MAVPVEQEKKEDKASKLTQAYGEPPALVKRDRGNTKNLLHRGPLLGEGGFARVYSAIEQCDGSSKALKVISKQQLKTPKNRGKLFAEIKLHQAMAHDNIVRFEECFEDFESVYMVMELCEVGSMLDMLRKRKRYTETEARFYLVQLVSACHYMHSRSVIHRDLKLGNLFLDKNMNLKVGDFGLAALVRFPGERKKTICGTPNYIAPEILFDRDNGHSFEVDIWSIGVILYTCLIGKPPFQTKDVKAIYKKIKDNAYAFPQNVLITDEATDLISAILNTNPDQRPILTDILQHNFFTSKSASFPKSIPQSAMHTKPDFSYLNPVSSAANFKLCTAALTKSMIEEEQPTSNSGPLPANLLPRTEEIPAAAVKSVAKAQESEVRSALAPDSPISELLNSARKPLCVSPAHSGRLEKAKEATVHSSSHNTIASSTHVVANSRPKSDRDAAVRTTLGSIQTNSGSAPRSSSIPQQLSNLAQRRSPMKESKTARIPVPPLVSAPAATRQDVALPLSAISTSSRELYESCWMSLEQALSVRTASAWERLDSPEHVEQPKNFISSWIDYTHKYGTAYKLTDGSVGVYFNDSTSMLLAPNKTRVDYISNKKNADGLHERRNYSALETFSTDPVMRQKVQLIHYFQDYIVKHLERPSDWNHTDNTKVNNLDFLVKYYRMKSAIVFKMSNNVIQFNFFDHSKVVLSENAKVVSFIGQDYRLKTYTLAMIIKEGLKLNLLKTSAAGKTLIQMPSDLASADPKHSRRVEVCFQLLQKLDYCCEVLRALVTRRREADNLKQV